MRHFEIEQKYRLRDPQLIRALLKKVGAKKVSGGREDNEFFDKKGFLKKQRIALRLRHYTGRRATLTLKGPRLKSRFTKRLEIETPVEYQPTRELLTRLGFKIWMRYAKQREVFRWKKAIVTVDQLRGFGTFLEIEASPDRIASLAKVFGLRPSDREERSYLHMLFNWKH